MRAYDARRGEHRLTRFVESPLDGELRAALTEAATPPSLGASGSTLLQFGRRGALLALREADPGWCTAGLAALARLDPDDTDTRDIAWAAALIRYALDTVGDSAADRFEAAAVTAASEEVGSLLAGFTARGDGLDEWGYRHVTTGGAAGLMPWSYARYGPTHDLIAAALETSELLDRGPYLSDDPEGGVAIPDVWFRPSRRLGRRLEALSGAVLARGTLDAGDRPPDITQRVLVFIGESADAGDARWLADRPNAALEGREVRAFARDELVAVVIGGSWQVGRPSEAPPGELDRIVSELSGLLERAADRADSA